MGHFDRYWEMRKGGPYEAGDEIFKCRDCGAETAPALGHSGEPEPGLCHKACCSRDSDWRPGRVSHPYKHNFERIFPDSPGAGI